MYLSVRAFAKKIKRSATRVQQLLAQGRISGVQRMEPNRWLIPETAVVKPPKKRNGHFKKIR